MVNTKEKRPETQFYLSELCYGSLLFREDIVWKWMHKSIQKPTIYNVTVTTSSPWIVLPDLMVTQLQWSDLSSILVYISIQLQLTWKPYQHWSMYNPPLNQTKYSIMGAIHIPTLSIKDIKSSLGNQKNNSKLLKDEQIFARREKVLYTNGCL